MAEPDYLQERWTYGRHILIQRDYERPRPIRKPLSSGTFGLYGGPDYTSIDAFNPDPLIVEVDVGLTKVQAAEAAAQDFAMAVLQQGLAAGFAIAAAAASATVFGIPAGIVLGGLAAAAQLAAFGFQQAAQGNASRANDPPVPDFSADSGLR